jgi:Zn-dependent peptidase ImmA (M78 family)
VLTDKHAPLIFVNGADAKAAQMFTLAHELAHVWLGVGGVFDLPRMMAGKGETEQFCNAVAAEFLVPEVEFRAVWEAEGATGKSFEAFARRFKVSQLVVARRALDLGFIDRAAFFAFYREYMAQERTKKDAATGGGNFFLTQEARIGRRFGTYVVRAAREGRLLYRDAYHLTGLHGKTFDQYADGLGFGIR